MEFLKLAHELNDFAFDYDPYGYRDSFSSCEEGLTEMYNSLTTPSNYDGMMENLGIIISNEEEEEDSEFLDRAIDLLNKLTALRNGYEALKDSAHLAYEMSVNYKDIMEAAGITMSFDELERCLRIQSNRNTLFYRLSNYADYLEQECLQNSAEYMETRWLANCVDELIVYDTYQVSLHYDGDYRGLCDMETVTDWDMCKEFAHNYAMNGGYIRIRNIETGKTLEFDSDKYVENFDGEWPLEESI